MPSPDKIPLSFNRDRAVRQLDARLEELLEKLRKNRPSEDPWMIRRAYEIATERHHDQFRSSGEPYLTHLLEVAHILADMRLDATTLTAAILHDAIEDTETTREELAQKFSKRVAALVVEVTDDMTLPKDQRRQQQIIDAPKKSSGAKLIKIADKISNIRARILPQPSQDERKDLIDYLAWAEKVVAGCRGVNAVLDRTFDETVKLARSTL